MEGPAIRRHTVKGETTRKALLEAARELFGEKSYLTTEISDIVGRAGKSTGVFYLYFANKDELLSALVDEFRTEHNWYFNTDSSLLVEHHRRVLIERFWDTHERHGNLLGALRQAASVNERFRLELEDLRRPAVRDMTALIRKAQLRGHQHALDAELTAVALGELAEHTVSYWISHRVELEQRGLDRAHAIDHLNGLFGLVIGEPIAAQVLPSKRGVG